MAQPIAVGARVLGGRRLTGLLSPQAGLIEANGELKVFIDQNLSPGKGKGAWLGPPLPRVSGSAMSRGPGLSGCVYLACSACCVWRARASGSVRGREHGTGHAFPPSQGHPVHPAGTPGA